MSIRRTITTIMLLGILLLAFCTIGGSAETAQILHLPTNLNRIEAEAFLGTTSLDTVVVPEGVISIGSKAFASSSLRKISLPSSLTEIAEDAFADCGAFTVEVPENCYAYTWCVAHGYLQEAFPESPHPYTNNYDNTWIYTAEENVEELTITFSNETETEQKYDFIYIYDLSDTQIGKYSGTELAGQRIVIADHGFKIRLTSDSSNTRYGFSITNIEKRISEPLTFKSLTLDKPNPITGNLLTFTTETTGGVRPLQYEYSITLANDEVARGIVAQPDLITYVPVQPGEYTISVIVRDNAGNALDPHSCAFHVSAAETTDPALFTYETLNGLFAQITGYSGTDTVVVIPEEIDDYTIQKIGSKAFQGNKLLEYVYIPDTVTIIDSRAFDGCTALNGFDLGNGVQTLQEYAFRGCTAIRDVYLPDSVTGLAHGVFMNCANLENVNYPVNWTATTSYGEIFANCPKLTEINVPEGVTSIPKYAFAKCSNLKKITLPEGLEHVNQHAFLNCTGLTEMVYPSTIKTVGGISGCTGITEISIPSGAVTIGANAFDSVPITNIFIPATVTAIDNYAFQNCTDLDTINFNEGLKSVGLYAFYKCTAVVEIALPNSVESIGAYAFANCSNLAEFNYPVNWTSVTRATSSSSYGHHFDNCTKLKTISIPDGAKVIPRAAFAYATYLRNVSIPNSVQTVAAEAFKECTAITSISLSEGITQIGQEAFRGCIYLSKIEFPSTLKSIDHFAFMECSALKQASLPDGMSTIGTRVFADCVSLESVNYPVSLNTAISYPYDYQYANGCVFMGCKKLKSITIPEGVTTIPNGVFNKADYLVNISFPSTLVNIECFAFSGCSSLTAAMLPDGLSAIGVKAFENCINLETIHYPKQLKTTTYYPYDYRYPYGCVFSGCSKLKKVEIPNEVSSIPRALFRCANGLEKIYLGNNIKEIGDQAFDSCPNLTIWTEYGACALQYAKDNSIAYYYLTPDGVNIPSGTLYKGDSYALYGYARASIPISNITATIWDSTGANILQQISVAPETTDYSLSGAVNMGLRFGELALGSYHYTLTAKTDLSDEIWANSVFTIAPPPLRIHIRDAHIPGGLTDVGSAYAIGGTVVSNYPIDTITVNLYTANGVERYTNTATPNALTYSLAELTAKITIASLPVEEYRIRITAVSKGETRVLADSTFQPVNLDGEVDEKTLQAVVKFVSNDDNGSSLFPMTYVNNALGRMDSNDVLLMAINGRNSWLYGTVSTLFSENNENMYLVELYENELASTLSALDPKTIELPNFSSTEKLFTNAVLNGEMDVINAYKQGMLDRFNFKDNEIKQAYMELLDSDFKEIASAISKMKDTLKGIEITVELANSFSLGICNYLNGIEIMSMLSDSLDGNNSAEFTMAVRKLYSKYKSESLNHLLSCMDIYAREILKCTTNELVKVMANAASELNSYIDGATLYNIVNFAIDVSMKATGYSTIAENYQTFMIRVQAYTTGIKTYSEAFSAIKEGDTSSHMINRLMVAFTYCRQASTRIHETICDLNSTPDTEKQKILDYIENLKATKIVD